MKYENVLSQLAALPQLSGRELQERYRSLYGKPAPNSNKSFLLKRVAHRVQELAYGQTLSEKAVVQLDSMLEDSGLDPKTCKSRKGLRGTDGRKLSFEPGKILKATYKGVECSVVPDEFGKFDYDGQKYDSLNKVIHAITGTHRSAREFFNLSPSKNTARRSR